MGSDCSSSWSLHTCCFSKLLSVFVYGPFTEAMNGTVELDPGFIYKVVYKACALTGFVLPYRGINKRWCYVACLLYCCNDLFFLYIALLGVMGKPTFSLIYSNSDLAVVVFFVNDYYIFTNFSFVDVRCVKSGFARC